jgi:flavodoxin-like protein
MRAVVAYESWFGNTVALAEAVADELRADHEVTLVSVDEPPPSLDGVDLLVLGAPTHVHGLSSRFSRRAALEQKGEEREPGGGTRGWLAALPPGAGRRAAAFDTRIDKPVVLVGSAARTLARRLARKGFALVAPVESFFVRDSEGPLEEGELERARAWARRLAA